MNKYLMCGQIVFVHIFLGFILLASNVEYLHAQSCLRGRILFQNESGHGNNTSLTRNYLPAQVYANDLQVGTSIDSLGDFHICDIPNGKHEFTVSCIGYQTVHFVLQTRVDTFTEIVLQQRVVESSELTITGFGILRAGELKTSAQAIQTVDTRVWERSLSQGLVQVLATQPGVSAISTGAAIAKPVIRGLGYNRIVTINDGVRQEGQQWGDEHGIEIDEFGISKVEVLKGPGSLMYGSDAIAGVINIIDPLPDRKQLIKGKVMLGYQTNNGQRNTAVLLSGGKNRWSYAIRASSKDAHCYQNKRDGYVANSGFDNSSAKATVTTHRKWGFSQLIYSAYLMKVGIIEGERDSVGRFITPQLIGGNLLFETNTDSVYRLYELQYPRQDILHQKLVSSTRVFFGERNLKMIYSVQENVRKEIGTAFQMNAPDLFMRLRTGTYQLEMNGDTKHEKHWTMGLNGMLQESMNYGAEQLISNYNLWDAGLYGMLFGSWRKMYWQSGLRYDSRWMAWEGMLKRFGGMSGSVGGSYNFRKEHFVKVNFSKGYRAPNPAELTSDGVHEGALRYEVGNANLKAESSLQTDVQLLLNWRKHFSANVSLFQNNINNFVYISKLSNSQGSDSLINEMPVFAFNGKQAVLHGFEVQYDYHPHPFDWLHIGQSLSYVSAHFVGERKGETYYLPSIPPMRLNNSIEVDIDHVGHYLKDLEIGLNYQYVWTQTQYFGAYATETSTPGYGLLNAQLSMGVLSKAFESLNVVMSANNLLDVVYQDHLSRLKYAAMNPTNAYSGVWNMGRNFALKVLMGI